MHTGSRFLGLNDRIQLLFKFWEYRERNLSGCQKRASSLIRFILEEVVSSPVSITASMSSASPSQGQGTSPNEMTSGDRFRNPRTLTSYVFLAPTSVIDGRAFFLLRSSCHPSWYRVSMGVRVPRARPVAVL